MVLCFLNGVGGGWEEWGRGRDQGFHLDSYSCKYRVRGQMSTMESFWVSGERGTMQGQSGGAIYKEEGKWANKKQGNHNL